MESPKGRWAITEGLPLRHPFSIGTLSPVSRNLFIATNLAYWAVALLVLTSTQLAAQPAFECLSWICPSPIFHGLTLTTMAAVSTVWHSAQCELMDWFSSVVNLSSSKYLRRLLLGDIFCTLFVVSCGIFCFGSWRTCFWLGPACTFFFIGRSHKLRQQYESYALWHGIWHVHSAFAASQIVFNASMPPWQ